ncbi:hypothetical protein H5410_041701 [Solanum commersonii]|uniref:Uncharacterized protein n=1 Tax=Solanum commersonii TaxID=4109 RepID=A0A9J5XSB3_SOLCO|nr:hypothetical protein H5410_041701 [Solanum commersonii]
MLPLCQIYQREEVEDVKIVPAPKKDEMLYATFTWFKGDNQVIASRIDRILISEEWDHTPLALQGFEGFTDRIREWRNSFNFTERPHFILAYKLNSFNN